MWEFFIGMVWIGVFIGGFRSIFLKWEKEEEDYQNIMNPPEEYIITTPEATQEDSSPMSKHDWDVICRTAIDKAKLGDSSARNWVMKNIISEHTVQSPFVNDAVLALTGVGFKKAHAESLVNNLVSLKTYNNLDDLIKDALNHK